MQGKQLPDVLTWKISYLFSESNHDEIIKTIEMIDQVNNILPTMRYDAILESKISDAFYKAKVQLSTKLIKDRNQLLVLCSDMDLYNKIFKNFLAFGTLCIQHRDFDNLYKALSTMKKSNMNISFNALLIEPLPTQNEIKKIEELNLDSKIYIWEKRAVNSRIEKMVNETNIILANPTCNLEYGCPKVFDMAVKITSDTDKDIERLEVE